MVISFFASNPIFYFNQVACLFGRQGSPKSPACRQGCTGHFSFMTIIILNFHFTGISEYINKKRPLGIDSKGSIEFFLKCS